jgi:hypothetical protein
MAITLQKHQRIGDVKIIKVEGKRDKEEQVMVRHEIVPPEWRPWNHEDFSREWNKTYPTKKKEMNLK